MRLPADSLLEEGRSPKNRIMGVKMGVSDQVCAAESLPTMQRTLADQRQISSVRVIRLNDVMHMTGLGRSSIYKFIDEGIFPRSVPLGGRSVGWIEAEILGWIRERIEARDSQVRAI